MPTSELRYDASRMGFATKELSQLGPRLEKAKRAVLTLSESGEQGWMGLPEDADMMSRIASLVKEKRHFKHCLVLGIGGSDLGTRAAWHALLTASQRENQTHGMKLWFAGANTDPDELADILSRLDLKNTLVNIISKSGDTIEPMASFLVVRDALIKAVGKTSHADHIVATTDSSKGSLRALAEREDYATLPVVDNVGGRFSVLTDVSLFPLACAGIDIAKLLKGAAEERDHFLQEKVSKNSTIQFAALNYLAYAKQDRKIQVLMPYAESLRLFGTWYRQLWAESLGKKVDRSGKTVNIGPTPIAALGATDQHSQIQLYNEGPNDKVITFIEVERFTSKLRVPSSAKTIPSLAYASGISLETVIHAEREATSKALTQNGRSNGTIFLSDVSVYSLGRLIMFFELAVAVSGELYDINAFDQPGVEAGKQAMRKILSK